MSEHLSDTTEQLEARVETLLKAEVARRAARDIADFVELKYSYTDQPFVSSPETAYGLAGFILAWTAPTATLKIVNSREVVDYSDTTVVAFPYHVFYSEIPTDRYVLFSRIKNSSVKNVTIITPKSTVGHEEYHTNGVDIKFREAAAKAGVDLRNSYSGGYRSELIGASGAIKSTSYRAINSLPGDVTVESAKLILAAALTEHLDDRRDLIREHGEWHSISTIQFQGKKVYLWGDDSEASWKWKWK